MNRYTLQPPGGRRNRWGKRIGLLPLVLSLLPLTLASCSSCSGDPTQAGFFCGVSNIATGAYERRQAVLTHEADVSKGYAASQQGRLHSLQQEEAGLKAEQARLQANLASLQTDLQRERALLKAAEGNRTVAPQQLDNLEEQRSALQNRRHVLAGSSNVTRQDVEALRQANQQLQQKINEALNRRAVE
jgi:chromosome segregation ATPase